jgi:hypothetical protein
MASSAETIARAMSFHMEEVVERYAKDQDLPLEIARTHERELKRYLALSALEPEGYGMRGPIDELWHTFIMFTEKYATFCNQVAGRFLHHTPNTSDRNTKPPATSSAAISAAGSVREGYVRFLEAYQKAFGEVPPPHLWPRPMKHEDPHTAFDGCGCTTCSCVGGGCNCTIAIAEPARIELPEPEFPAVQLPFVPEIPEEIPEGEEAHETELAAVD